MKHLIGAGHIAEKIIKDHKLNNKFKIYDNNKNLQGKSFFGETINPVKSLLDVASGEIIICSSSVSEIISQIKDLGIKLKFHVPGILSDYSAILSLENLDMSFLLASGLPSQNLYGAIGGLYKVTIKDNNLKIKRLIKSSCHGIKKDIYDTNYYITDQENGVIILDKNLKKKKLIKLDKGLRIHGIDTDKDNIYVVCSNYDSLLKISKKNHNLTHFKFSNKYEKYDSPQHHANDVSIKDGYAYVSMFSVTGNWKRGIFDGGILQIDLSNSKTTVILNTLLMPHNVCFFEDKINVLNSFNGINYSYQSMPQYNFNGFIRGFQITKDLVVIGESRNRNTTGLAKYNLPISVDSKINIINRKSNFSRSISLPNKISEIHSILIIE